ncbi:MAG: DUF1499 domain-containing protein [Novosphingobium sp.]|nr:DUF1499 domain-containing protein [Novosphingobium sp.]
MMDQTQRPPLLARITKWLGLAALAIALIGPTLARYDIVSKIAGFSALLGAGALSLIGILTGMVALTIAWSKRTGGSKETLVGLIPAILVFGFLGIGAASAGKYPAIHDATTDLADPPEFTTLQLRKDNLAGVDTVANWRAIHAEAYPDLATIIMDEPVPAVVAKAEKLAKDRGWTVAAVEPAAGHLEATADVSWIRFHDDVVLRVRPLDGDARSEVDMRSVSRVGVGDLGENAKRVRAFMADLKSLQP